MNPLVGSHPGLTDYFGCRHAFIISNRDEFWSDIDRTRFELRIAPDARSSGVIRGRCGKVMAALIARRARMGCSF